MFAHSYCVGLIVSQIFSVVDVFLQQVQLQDAHGQAVMQSLTLTSIGPCSCILYGSKIALPLGGCMS